MIPAKIMDEETYYAAEELQFADQIVQGAPLPSDDRIVIYKRKELGDEILDGLAKLYGLGNLTQKIIILKQEEQF